MLKPKKTKYRRLQKGKMKGNTKRGAEITFGSFAIKALDECWMTGRQIEAARQAITNVKGNYGFAYFLINLLLKNRLKCVWVKVKVHRNIL